MPKFVAGIGAALTGNISKIALSLMGIAVTAGASFAVLVFRLAPFHTVDAILLVAAAFCVGYALAVAIYMLFQNDPTRTS